MTIQAIDRPPHYRPWEAEVTPEARPEVTWEPIMATKAYRGRHQPVPFTKLLEDPKNSGKASLVGLHQDCHSEGTLL